MNSRLTLPLASLVMAASVAMTSACDYEAPAPDKGTPVIKTTKKPKSKKKRRATPAIEMTCYKKLIDGRRTCRPK